MTSRTLAVAVLAVALATSCRRPSLPHAFLAVTVDPRSGIDLATAHADGTRVLETTLHGSTLVVELDAQRAGRVTVSALAACPVVFKSDDIRPGETLHDTLVPYLDLGAPRTQIGFDTPFTLTVRPGCDDARAGKITWRAVSGAPIVDGHASDSDFLYSGRTETLADALGSTPPTGLIPLSPRTRGETELEATWSGPASAPSFSRRVTVSAAARSRGLPNVTTGAAVYLGGKNWRVDAAPPESHAVLVPHGDFATLAPDVRGPFTLADDSGHALRLVAGKYDETPLDCGRSDCHADLSRAAAGSPMSTVLQRGLDGPFAGDYPTCAIGCHAIGEPGMDDGGFVAVARALGRSLPDLARGGFHELPAPLRRLSSVGCQGCHGTGAIPEASGRWAILRSDVCATCHDAPPRYGHVAALRTSRMSRSDLDPRARTDAACVRCHTTWGALDRPAWRPPDDAAPFGIGCAACHAVHPASHGSAALGETCAASLARDAKIPPLLEGAVDEKSAKRSFVCLSCHTPSPSDSRPMGTAAALWAGRGGLDPATGAALTGPAPAAIDGGCIGCHHEGPPGLALGSTHAFHATRDPKTSDPSIRARAIAIFAQAFGGSPPVSHGDATRIDRSTARGRAAWNLALVLDDPAADVHGATYARSLLDAAERALGGGATKP